MLGFSPLLASATWVAVQMELALSLRIKWTFLYYWAHIGLYLDEWRRSCGTYGNHWRYGEL